MSSVLDEAFSMAAEAVTLDHSGELTKAKEAYMAAADMFLKSCHEEKNGKRIELIKRKVMEFLERAEVIAAMELNPLLDEARRFSTDAALAEKRGDLLKAKTQLGCAIERFLEALKLEAESGALTSTLRAEAKLALARAERLDALMKAQEKLRLRDQSRAPLDRAGRLIEEAETAEERGERQHALDLFTAATASLLELHGSDLWPEAGLKAEHCMARGEALKELVAGSDDGDTAVVVASTESCTLRYPRALSASFAWDDLEVESAAGSQSGLSGQVVTLRGSGRRLLRLEVILGSSGEEASKMIAMRCDATCSCKPKAVLLRTTVGSRASAFILFEPAPSPGAVPLLVWLRKPHGFEALRSVFRQILVELQLLQPSGVLMSLARAHSCWVSRDRDAPIICFPGIPPLSGDRDQGCDERASGSISESEDRASEHE